jgi:hypothetical protein
MKAGNGKLMKQVTRRTVDGQSIPSLLLYVVMLCTFGLVSCVPTNSDTRKKLQAQLNYTMNGKINCDPLASPEPGCVDGKSNRLLETTPFNGKGACSDVIRTMSSQNADDLSTMDADCADEAAWKWSKTLGKGLTKDSGAKEVDYEKILKQIRKNQTALNYTIAAIESVWECVIYSDVAQLYMTTQLHADDLYLALPGTCVSVETPVLRINCDKERAPQPLCVGTKVNQARTTVPFTGRDACEDVTRTMSLADKRYETVMDEECSQREKRRKLDYLEVCSKSRRFTYHFWFRGHCLARKHRCRPQDEVMHNHLHNAQDNHRQFIGAAQAQQYERMVDGDPWQRVAFTEGNWIDTAENSHVYSCAEQDKTFIHVKGWIRGDYLAYNQITRIGDGTSCTIGHKRPLGAPPGFTMYGALYSGDCFMDVDYGNT